MKKFYFRNFLYYRYSNPRGFTIKSLNSFPSHIATKKLILSIRDHKLFVDYSHLDVLSLTKDKAQLIYTTSSLVFFFCFFQ